MPTTPPPATTTNNTTNTTTSAHARLSKMSAHLASPAAAPTPAKRPPITCHVLDTTTGRPGPAIPVTLTLLSPYGPSAPLTATTNADGRVTAWSGPEGPEAAERTLEELFTGDEGEMVWALRLDVKAFWQARGVRAFFEEVEVRFVVRGEGRGEHFHVPVLLGPYSYTTYRGS